MIIGIDIDDVLAEFIQEYLIHHNSINDTAYVKEDIRDYDLQKVLPYTREEILKKIFAFYEHENFRKLPTLTNAKEVIDILKKTHELHAITARPIFTKQNTTDWITKNFSDAFKSINFSNEFGLSKEHKNKPEICEDLNVNIMIEDSPKYAEAISKKGIKVLMITQPWNTKYQQENVERVKDWNEILEKINALQS